MSSDGDFINATSGLCEIFIWPTRKLNALRSELSWTHYRLLLRVEKPEARAFYEAEAVNSRWSTRELERQINSLLFERLALSRDKAGVLELAKKGHEIQKPADRRRTGG